MIREDEEIAMRLSSLALLPLLFAFALPAGAQHAMVNTADLRWGPAPPALPAGAEAAVLSGDPSKPGAFTVRLKFPAGYRVPPHTHPTDELVTIISGDLSFGMGEAANPAGFTEMKPGGFVNAPAGMAHYVQTKTGAVVQVNAQGPFEVRYINPADDPRK